MILAQLVAVVSLSLADYRSGDVCPNPPGFHHADNWAANAKAVSDGLLPFASSEQGTDNRDVGIFEFRERLAFSARERFGVGLGAVTVSTGRAVKPVGGSMLRISQVGNVFKVQQSAVQFDAVLVVNFRSEIVGLRWGAWTDERFRNEHMHGGVSAWVPAETNGKIPFAVYLWLHRCGRAVTAISQASDAPKIRYLVASLEADYRPPFFGVQLFGGKLAFSHVSPPSKESVVRVGVGVSTPLRPVYCTASVAA